MIIPSARPCLDESDRQAVLRVFDSGLIADGEEIPAFEAELAACLGLPGAVAVGSGFAALHLALLGLGVGAGDEVVIPCVSTCPAMRNAVWATGATPVYADVNRDDFNLSVESVRAALTPRAKAVIAPHHTGVIADIPALSALGVPVIEDCAQALGGTWRGRPAGSLGAAAAFSFYATKIITTVDGGAVASPSADVLERVRGLRYYRHCGDGRMRFNYKMQNLGAALGRSQLKKLPLFLRRRAHAAARLKEVLARHGVTAFPGGDGDVGFRLAARFPARQRAALCRALEAKGCPVRADEMQDMQCREGREHGNARRLMQEVLTFPLYPALSDDQVNWLVRTLDLALTEIGA